MIIPILVAVLALPIVYILLVPPHDLPDAQGDDFQLSDKIKNTIQKNVDNGLHPALFVGIIDENKTEYYYYGHTTYGEDAIDENTIFEIGSISKVFTSLLLADMVERGEVNLDDPVDKFLPENVTVPSKNDVKITLYDLATHTSGLPREADNNSIIDVAEYVKYDKEKLYDYLSYHQLSRDVGSQYEYSNTGGVLLGHVLSLHASKSYEDLLKERIFDKLEMTNSCIQQCDDLREKFAIPHALENQVIEFNPPVDLAGAGGVRSSGKDMLSFLSYAMNLKDSDLKSSFALTQKVNHKINEQLSVGLGWHMLYLDEHMIIWHNGRTLGFSSFVGFDPELNQGVVVLSNSNTIVDDIGIWLLEHGYE